MYTFTDNVSLAIALAIGAVVANVFSIALALIESAKSQDKEDY